MLPQPDFNFPGLGFQEGQYVRIDDVRMTCKHAMGEVFVDLQRPPLQELGGEWRRVRERYNLIVFAVHDQDWSINALQVFRQVGFWRTP